MVLIEAESNRVRRVNYEIISDDDIPAVASGGQAVRIKDTNIAGVLKFEWTAEDGLAGKYDIRIAHFDENDGNSPLIFSVNEKVYDYTFNIDLPGAEGFKENFVPLRGANSSGTLSVDDNPNPIFKGVDLAPDNVIEISVQASGNNKDDNLELGRIDAIEITPAEEIIPSLDLFWHHSVSEKVGVWTLNEEGTSLETAAFITDQSGEDVLVPDENPWEGRGVLDNGDGNRNLLWRDTVTGGVAIWKMEGSEFQEQIIIDPPADGPGSNLDWEIRGTGDVNSGGGEEIFWYNTSTGDIAVSEIHESGFGNATFITDTSNQAMIISPDDDWQLLAAGDMDGDGDADAIWENITTQQFAYWELDGTVYQNPVLIDSPAADGDWEFRGAYDANNDGIDDFFFRSGSGETGIWMIENNSVSDDNIFVIDTVEDTNFSFYV